MSKPTKTYDLIVCGGGPSGSMAAIAAARLGLKVLVMERHGFLGGMNTAGLVGPIMTFHAGSLQIVRGIAGEIFDQLKSWGALPAIWSTPFGGTTSMTPIDTEIYKSLLLKELSQSGAELLLHSVVAGGEKKISASKSFSGNKRVYPGIKRSFI